MIPFLQRKQAVTPSNNCATATHTELWCELEKRTPLPTCQKIVIIYFLLEQITLLPYFIMKSVIISTHIYDICDANGGLRSRGTQPQQLYIVVLPSILSQVKTNMV